MFENPTVYRVTALEIVDSFQKRDGGLIVEIGFRTPNGLAAINVHCDADMTQKVERWIEATKAIFGESLAVSRPVSVPITGDAKADHEALTHALRVRS